MPALNGFNANEIEPRAALEPVPAGRYLAEIVDSRTKPTKSGAGDYLQLEFEILDGPQKGRSVWERLTLWHPNQTTVRIAKAHLSAICRAVGVLTPRDSAELHRIPLSIVVGLRRRPDSGEMTNVVTSFDPRGTDTDRPAAVAGSIPPWSR